MKKETIGCGNCVCLRCKYDCDCFGCKKYGTIHPRFLVCPFSKFKSKIIEERREKFMIEDKIIRKLKEIQSTKKEIREMQELNADRLNELNQSLKSFQMKVTNCTKCRGTGRVSYSYGYQDGCTGEQDCGECSGTGYVIEEILPVVNL